MGLMNGMMLRAENTLKEGLQDGALRGLDGW